MDSTWIAELLARAEAVTLQTLDRLTAHMPTDVSEALLPYLPVQDHDRWIVVGAVAVSAVLLLISVRALRRRSSRKFEAGLAELTRGPRRLGYGITVVLCLGLGTWAFTAPLESAAIAPGVIAPEGNRRTVQHLEGGIVRAIQVTEGDTVTAGQVLLVLEDVEARAHFEEIGRRYAHLFARAARLDAELQGAGELPIPAAPPRVADAGEFERAMVNQKALFETRLATQRGRNEILKSRIRQLEEEISGLGRMNVGLDDKASLIAEEITVFKDLVAKGLEKKPRLLALERAATDIGIQRASNGAAIAQNRQKIGETEAQIISLRQQAVEQASNELTDVRRALAEIDSEMPWRADVLKRTEIRAPIDGTVMNMRVTTRSGVVRAGEPILDIVPSEVPLIIDAQVKPTDVDVVTVGMRARVILSAYQQRNMPQVFGTLHSISADRFIDERSGHSYYLAKVEVPHSEIDRLPAVQLVAGMPAEVMLLTGSSTVADYVIGPLMASFRMSFRENQGS